MLFISGLLHGRQSLSVCASVVCHKLVLLIGVIAIVVTSAQVFAQAPPPPPATQTLSLEQCLQIAREKNHTRPASKFAVAIAEAQHRQALAGYWPQINAKGGVERTDEPLNFIFPASQMYIPSQTVSVPGGQALVTIPAGAFGPGFPPVAVQLPVAFPGQSITTQAQLFPIPAQDIKVLNPTTSSLSGDLKLLLFDGGMRHGYKEQAAGAIDAANADVRRTDLELTESVTRLYYAAVLAHQLKQLGDDTLTKMDTTLRVTESLYKTGAGTVSKADYLDNKVMVETVRSMVAQLQANESSAQAALAYTMGLPWNSTVIPSSNEIPYLATDGKLEDLVGTAYQVNPDWAKIQAGLRAFEGQRLTAASGHYPKVAFTGELHRFWNSYDNGISTPQNKTGWTIGGGVEIPIFDGFLTSAKVAEAQARINKLKEEKILLQEGIGLQIRELMIKLNATEASCISAKSAMEAAAEDDDLTTRGYGTGLLTTEKVIRAQLQAALTSVQYYKAVYDHRELQMQIDTAVGKEIQTKLLQLQ